MEKPSTEQKAVAGGGLPASVGKEHLALSDPLSYSVAGSTDSLYEAATGKPANDEEELKHNPNQ